MAIEFTGFLKRLMNICLSFFLVLSLICGPLASGAMAAKTSMTGDYQKDTSSVANTLKEPIAIANEAEDRSSAEDEAVVLIEDYISRYRNRPQFNQSVSFTTMQTALNALAGHYKNYNRPLSEDLKERVNKELAKAQSLLTEES